MYPWHCAAHAPKASTKVTVVTKEGSRKGGLGPVAGRVRARSAFAAELLLLLVVLDVDLGLVVVRALAELLVLVLLPLDVPVVLELVRLAPLRSESEVAILLP